MYVQREDSIPYLDAPSRDDCAKELPKLIKIITNNCNSNNDIGTDGLMPLEVCIEAFKSLSLIIKDLARLTEKLQPSSTAECIRNDVQHLLRLASYLMNWPLYALRECLRYESNKAPAEVMQPRSQEAVSLADQQCYRNIVARCKHYISLWDSLYLKILVLVEKCDPTPEHCLKWFVPSNNTIQVPAVGMLELLLRIAAELRASPSIEDTVQAFYKLAISHHDSHDYRGIPAVFVICTKKPDKHPTRHPTHVITSTVDIWAGFSAVHSFLRKARNHRLKFSPFVQRKEEIAMITSQSLLLKENHSLTTPQTIQSEFRARYKNVNIRPLESPSFALKSRCARCHAMFDYEIEEKLQMVEQEYMGDAAEIVFNQDMNCAETHAHFYSCQCFEVERY